MNENGSQTPGPRGEMTTEEAVALLAQVAPQLVDDANQILHRPIGLERARQVEPMQRFRQRHALFAPAFAQLELMLAGLVDPKGTTIGQWSGASACEILLRVADTIDNLPGVRDFEGLDCGELGTRVRAEVGVLVRRIAVRAPATEHPPSDDGRPPVAEKAPPTGLAGDLTLGSVAKPSDGLRIAYKVALKGCPDTKLRPTPKATLHRWVKNPKNWARLGISKTDSDVVKHRWSRLSLLVAGLLELWDSDDRGKAQPQAHANARDERSGRKKTARDARDGEKQAVAQLPGNRGKARS